MTPFLPYVGRSSLYLALFYAFFLLAMRRTTFFRLNRILLLAGTLACFLLPLLRIRTVTVPLLVAGPLTEVASEPASNPSAASPFPYLEVLYLAGFFTVLGWTAAAMARMYRTIRAGSVRHLEDGTKLVLLEADVPSFSWGRTIVMGRKDAEANPVILQHEKAHIQKKHTLDILLFTAVTLVHWFNPLVWITLSELKLLHEYEADDTVLDKGIDAAQYQLLLVRKAVGDKRFTLANGFQHAKLKNRIDMMLCNPVRAKVVSVDLPETILSETAALPDTTKTIPFASVEVKPTFQGGDAGEFAKWVNENLQYPQAAKDANVQGRVVAQFVVGNDGKVGDVKILRGVHPDLDAEVVRVISSSPDWTPGYVKGEPVKVTYTFPVVFKTRGDATPTPNTVQIRGEKADSILVILDGKEGPKLKDINPDTIESISVLKDEAAIEKYGEKGRHGVIEITSKKQ